MKTTLIEVVCDFCGLAYTVTSLTELDDWYLTAPQDYCPACRKDK